jgi:hypothetical protein
MVQGCRNQDEARTSIVPNQLHGISSLKQVITSRKRDVTRGIQPRFVYQLAFPNHYEPMEARKWKKTLISMYSKKLRTIIYDHLNMQRQK